MPVGYLGVSVGLELRKQIRVEVKTWKLQLYIKVIMCQSGTGRANLPEWRLEPCTYRERILV